MELDNEVKRGGGRDHWRRAQPSVRPLMRAVQPPLLARAHAAQAFVPAADDGARAEGEAEAGLVLRARVELLPARRERPDVVHHHCQQARHPPL